MSVLLRIALRNLFEHRGKTLIIGTLVAVGVIVLVVGNALMDTARAGIERAFIDNYTADIIISGTAPGPVSLFGVQSVGGIDPTPVLPEFPAILSFLESHPHVSGWTFQITGFGFLRPNDERVEGLRNSVLTVLFGVEPATYARLFDNVRIVEGRYLQPGEIGVMVSIDRLGELRDAALKALGDGESEAELYSIGVGDQIRVVGLNATGLPRIRVVPLVGVFENTGINEGVGFELVSYIDPQTLRAIQGLNLGRGSEVVLSDLETELLELAGGSLDLDDLFGGELFSAADDWSAGDDAFFVDDLVPVGARAGAGRTEDPPEVEGAGVPSETWNYILVRADAPRRVAAILRDLERFFASGGIDAQAGNWEVAAGPFATTADVIRTVFNVAIIVIGIVALIIMTNTLVISVMERTGEIGMMRALGAQRGFVWRMFMYETLVITTTFGLIGVTLALVVIGILNAVGIEATNTFLTVLFAGPQLKPVASIASVATSLLVVSVIGLLAHVYPVTVALRIEPVRAMQTE